ncbi:MAG: helix-turn-helix transcriptional regulator [Candidatus Marinimicrobia bacterium]|nr:helix-turn-helix transcriptional regulator [Candidatus Neomarinimicrobiota bacterium]
MTLESNAGEANASDDKVTNVGARVAEYTNGLGERIRQVRRGIDLTQDEFGERLGVTRQSVNGYEKGRLLPPTPMIVKIADLTNYNPWWLLFGIGNPSPISTDSGLSDGDLLEDLSGLSETQRIMIKYIKEEKNAAEQMARLLWKKALDI